MMQNASAVEQSSTALVHIWIIAVYSTILHCGCRVAMPDSVCNFRIRHGRKRKGRGEAQGAAVCRNERRNKEVQIPARVHVSLKRGTRKWGWVASGLDLF